MLAFARISCADIDLRSVDGFSSFATPRVYSGAGKKNTAGMKEHF